MAWQPTAAESAAYSHMQARLIALLLRHDEPGFRRLIAPRADDGEADTSDPLRPYRDLGVFFHLADELFEHILPRIVRRLSFESPRMVTVEEPPAQGRVDWERTLQATWAERPGEAPLLLHTRQRRRDFATPENLLTVATLLEYGTDVEGLLWGERAAIGAEPLRHPLTEIADRCQRELAFPQFAGLREAAEAVLDGAHGGTGGLEAEVYERLLPGANNAYQELLAWRSRRRNLQLLRRDRVEADAVLGANPARDNYLYQLWIFYELADMLQADNRLKRLNPQPGQMVLEFGWGEGDGERVYRLRHDQAVEAPVAEWEDDFDSHITPGVRPDFYLQRVEPPPEAVRHKPVKGRGHETLIWREPGLVWDAKYYRERDSRHVPSAPVKRMIADLALLGEESGTLLFAFLRDEEAGVLTDATQRPVYHLAPRVGRDQTLVPQPRVGLRELRPDSDVTVATVRQTLRQLLDSAHERLATPRVPQCYGLFLDTLNPERRAVLVNRYGASLAGRLDNLLICPKPHIGPWRVDLVSRIDHCCRDPQFCHILGRPGRQKPMRPPRDAKELLRELEQLFAHPGELTEDMLGALERQVKDVSRQYAQFAGFEGQLDRYRRRARSLGLHTAFDRLGADQQESLALALFLFDRLEEVEAQDYSAPAIHLSSVLEHEVARFIFRCPGLTGSVADPRGQTLGALPGLRYSAANARDDEGNWPRLQAYAHQHWQPRIDPDVEERDVAFEDFVSEVDRVKNLRNKAAHPAPLRQPDYDELQTVIFQRGKRLTCGVLPALLMAWRD